MFGETWSELACLQRGAQNQKTRRFDFCTGFRNVRNYRAFKRYKNELDQLRRIESGTYRVRKGTFRRSYGLDPLPVVTWCLVPLGQHRSTSCSGVSVQVRDDLG